jgi:hypothetical protein
MKRTWSIALAAAVVVILGAVYCTRTGHAPAGQSSLVERLFRRHQLSDSRFEDLVFTLVGSCNRLIVFVRRKPGNCRFTILELANQ